MVIINYNVNFEHIKWLKIHIHDVPGDDAWTRSSYGTLNQNRLRKFKWLYNSEQIYFQNEEDALLFKLRWL